MINKNQHLVIFSLFMLVVASFPTRSVNAQGGFDIFPPDVEGEITKLVPANDSFLTPRDAAVGASAKITNLEKENFVKAKLGIALFKLNTSSGKFEPVAMNGNTSTSDIMDLAGTAGETVHLRVDNWAPLGLLKSKPGTYMITAKLSAQMVNKPWHEVDKKSHYFVVMPTRQ